MALLLMFSAAVQWKVSCFTLTLWMVAPEFKALSGPTVRSEPSSSTEVDQTDVCPSAYMEKLAQESKQWQRFCQGLVVYSRVAFPFVHVKKLKRGARLRREYCTGPV